MYELVSVINDFYHAPMSVKSIAIFCRIVFRGNDKTTALARPTEQGFHNVDKLLLVFHGPVNFVVVTRSQINHDVLVTVEEHYSAWIIQLVHFVEVRHQGIIHKINNGKVLDFLRTSVKRFIHDHACGVPVVAEADDDNTIFFGKDGLVHLPAVMEML